MLRRTLMLLALTAVLSPPHARADDRDREWEEDYSDQWTNEPAQSDDYRVSVDMDTGNDAGVTIDTFQGALSPYGDWVVAGGLGRVWRPHVAAGWRPYYYGRWEWTNEGWLWVSEEPFGWAAYHYGRWTYDGYYGWVWSPGYQWAPAWVSWRYSGDVVGWAPLGPGVSVYVSSYPFEASWWTFVPCDGFVGGPVYRRAFAPGYTRRYFDQTVAAPPRSSLGRGEPGRTPPGPAWGGPPPRVIETRIGRPLAPVRVVTAPSPGPSRVGNGEVSIFRPGSRGGRTVPVPSGPRPERPGLTAEPGRAVPVPGGPRGDRPVLRTDPGRAVPVPGNPRVERSLPSAEPPRAAPAPNLPRAAPSERHDTFTPRSNGPSGVREGGTGFGGGGRVPVPLVAPSTPAPPQGAVGPAAPAQRTVPAPARGGGAVRDGRRD
jgi:hypothetical protein